MSNFIAKFSLVSYNLNETWSEEQKINQMSYIAEPVLGGHTQGLAK